MAPIDTQPIAIIGTGCRFPGQSNSPSRLWELLKEPQDLLSKIPHDRFSAEGFHNEDSNYHGSSNVRHSYFLDENVRQFDAQFFGIKPVEANAIDPQQRLLLQYTRQLTLPDSRCQTSTVLIQLSTRELCCLLYTSPSPRDKRQSRMPSSA